MTFPRFSVIREIKRYLAYVSLVQTTMKPKEGRNYQEAIEALNCLQTNAAYIKTAAVKPKSQRNLPEVLKFLNRSGLSLDHLDTIPMIHVTGTNGKGSTCAYCESILRHHGYKTGFYSSPHLLDVRERIRINGKPIAKSAFAWHFWRMYDLLDKEKDSRLAAILQKHPVDMPLYFRFLTILAFHIFLEQKVDVAIIEVGIGGEYDCTNVIRNTVVAGITPLDLDHTQLLGNSLESIAWNKSGIMKEGTAVLTVNHQNSVLKVLEDRSIEKKSVLQVIDNDVFKPTNNSKIPPHIQKTNASLALAMCETFINKDSYKIFDFDLATKCIENTSWPGRYDVIVFNDINFYLDGAHTLDSIRICKEWFCTQTGKNHRKKGLIFNLIGPRTADGFFKELKTCNFDLVMFTPNIGGENDTNDNIDYTHSYENHLKRCDLHRVKWLETEGSEKSDEVHTFTCFSNAVKYLDDGTPYDVLVTGSIHLIGAALSVLDPTIRGTLSD